MSWRAAKSILKLEAQVNAAFPKRDKASDGIIGDERHQASVSDHNPNSSGVVDAIDIDHDPAHGCDTYKMAEQLRVSGDPRIKYVISNKRIANPAIDNFAWRPYHGADDHTGHVHLSVKQAVQDDDSPWNIPMLGGTAAAGSPKPAAPVFSIREVQLRLNELGYKLIVDNKAGPATCGAIMLELED